MSVDVLVAALIAGLAGSAHCMAMCGGIAGALGGTRNPWLLTGGRILGYVLAGAIAGGIGATLAMALAGTGAAPFLRIGFGLVLILIGMRTMTAWRGPRWLEALGARFWARLAPAAGRMARTEGHAATLALGFLWGWLPCGLVYAMLAAAIMSGGALEGAMVMAAFGVGTAPAVVGMMLVAGRSAAWLRGSAWRTLAGMMLVVFGLWTAAVPLVGHHM